MNEVTIEINGTPAPQGSKRHVGRGIMVESSRKVGPWRDAVRTETQAAVSGEPRPGAVRLEIEFRFPRPKNHFRTNGKYKDWAEYTPHTVRPDLDKLIRSTLDGLKEGGLYADDSQVVVVTALKRYVRDDAPGARVRAMIVDD